MADILRDIALDIKKEFEKDTTYKKIQEFKERLKKVSSRVRRNAILLDPVNLQPIKVADNLPSKGKYDFFNKLAKKISVPDFKKETHSFFNIIKKKEVKECPEGQILNPKTKRCIKEKQQNKPVKKCPEGQILNPKTKRCIKEKQQNKKCPSGQILNPKTKRCIKEKK